MKTNMKILSIIVFFVFIACSNVTDIKEIKNNPRNYENKEVVLKGVVTGTFSIPFVNFFEINDGTDSIRVITSKILPAKGQKIKIAGKVKYYTFLTENMMVIVEKDTIL